MLGMPTIYVTAFSHYNFSELSQLDAAPQPIK